MKKLLQSFLCASLLFVAFATKAVDDCCDNNTDCCDCACSSIFIPRSVGDDLRRQAIYRNYNENELSDDCCVGNKVFGIDYRYQRSRKGGEIARSLFGSSVLLFQGSDVENRNELALLADNFGLARNTNQQIGFCPRITNNIVDFEFYFEFNSWCGCEDLFMQFNLPVARTTWRLRAYDATGATISTNNCNNDCNDCDRCDNGCNDICGQPALPTPGTAAFCAGYMGHALDGNSALQTIAPAASFEAALGGNFLFGNMQTPWNAGRFNLGCDAEDTALASINMILGWNAWVCEDYHLGLFIRAAAPTGTELSCCNLCCDNNGIFAPQIGDNHWKLGGGITGHYDFYNCDDDHFVTLYFEGYAEHLFERCQVRSFDFTGKECLSRYMLLKEFNGSVPTGNLINAINFATRNVRTSFDVQGEGQLELGYRNNCGFSAGLGWNIYGRSCEQACTIGSPCDSAIIGRSFGFKGCQQVENVCVLVNNPVTVPTNAATVVTPLTLTSTVSNSTANSATARACGSIDSPQFSTAATTFPTGDSQLCVNSCGLAVAAGNTVANLNNPVGTVNINNVQVALSQSSITPATFTSADDNLDINSGLARSQITNKVFGHIDYQWDECKHSPKVYVGGEVEFASSNRCAGMNAWAFFIGGVMNF